MPRSILSCRSLLAIAALAFASQVADAQTIIDTKAVGGPKDSATGNFVDPTKFAIANNGIMYASFPTGIYASTNQGVSWVALAKSSISDFCFGPDSTLYIADGSGVFSSTNYGATWTNLSAQLPNGPFYSIIATIDGILMTGSPSGIFRSTDHGVNWDHVAETEFPAAGTGAYLTTTLKGTVLARNGNTYYRSTDDGATWQTSVPLTIQIWPISPINILRQSDNGLERSTDDGISWHLIAGSPKGLEYDVAMDKSGNLYTFYGWQLYVSHDSGTTWSASGTISGGGQELAFAPDNTLYFSRTSEGFWRTLKPLSAVRTAPAALGLAFSFDGARDVSFALDTHADVTVRLMDELGCTAQTLAARSFEAGQHTIEIPNSVRPGVYFCELTAGNIQRVLAIVLE